MIKIFLNHKKIISLILIIIFTLKVTSDSFDNNNYNNHGSVGIINMPSARFFDEGVHGIVLYDGSPEQKVTLVSNPYDWLEASFFYTNIQNRPYCKYNAEFCSQDYKDKGFNVKLRLKKEGVLPAIAIGLNDLAGTGFFNAEYLVGSYGVKNLDMHFGFGFGQLNGADNKIENPFTYINSSFNNRDLTKYGDGGTFNIDNYFSDDEVSVFYGLSYKYNNKLNLKFEKDTTNTNQRLVYKDSKSEYSFGFEYSLNNNFNIGASFERGSIFSLKFVYKNNPKASIPSYKYIEPDIDDSDDNYTKLIKNLESNGIGVERISETEKTLGIELTQFIHPNINLIEKILMDAKQKAGIEKDIKKDIKIADLKAVNEIDSAFKRNSKLIYERKNVSSVNTTTGFKFRPFIASREEFFKGAFLVENDTEFVLKENLFFTTNLKYSLANNFSDLRFPPVDTYPEQVRSDVKQYLKNMDKGILIGRAQLDYHLTPLPNQHLMITGGIFEDMFSGMGVEYLYFKENSNYSFGLELFHVKKRDYDWAFGHLDYKNTLANANFNYRNYGSIPFDMKLSFGEYLAGDVGYTVELSRTFRSGVKFGAFATFTDVTYEQFGEGSFDKGIFFNVPIYRNLINYTWKPLTKDPGAKLSRKNNLHSLLVRFRPLD